MPQLDPQSAELVSLFFAGFSLAVQLSSRKAELAAQPVPAPRRRRRSKYSGEVCAACLAYWHAAKHSTAARNGINTRMTYKAAFAYFASKLKEIGVKTVEMFKRIIHAVQSRECEGRRKELEAKKVSPEKKPTQKTAIFDIIQSMKSAGKAVLSTFLAKMGVGASGVVSDGSAPISDTPPPPIVAEQTAGRLAQPPVQQSNLNPATEVAGLGVFSTDTMGIA